MKETGGSKDGRKEENGERNATEDGRGKIICPKNGMNGINPVAAVYGQEYCYSLLDRIISLLKIKYFRNGCGVGQSF